VEASEDHDEWESVGRRVRDSCFGYMQHGAAFGVFLFFA
jgi:hypothetical protein